MVLQRMDDMGIHDQCQKEVISSRMGQPDREYLSGGTVMGTGVVPALATTYNTGRPAAPVGVRMPVP